MDAVKAFAERDRLTSVDRQCTPSFVPRAQLWGLLHPVVTVRRDQDDAVISLGGGSGNVGRRTTSTTRCSNSRYAWWVPAHAGQPCGWN